MQIPFLKNQMKKLYTFKNTINAVGEPYTRDRYETLDYILVPERWKNSIKNVEADKDTPIYSDHIALIATIQIKLKANITANSELRNKYEICDEMTRYEFNKKIKSIYEAGDWKTNLNKEVEENLPKIIAKENKTGISEELEDLIKDRMQAVKELKIEEAKNLNQEIENQRRREKKIKTLESVDKDLDLRDRYLGLRRLKGEYKPMPYCLKKEEGGEKRSVKKAEKAEFCANGLQEKFWKKDENEDRPERRPKIIVENKNYNDGEITLEEVRRILKKIKRRKAPGPDEIPMEAFKEMDDENLEKIVKMLNEWWSEEDVPEETLQARVVLIFKKGDTGNLANYRPISLTNSIYKILASIIQRRVAEKLDENLQKTQYGFRKNKSTSQAIHIIRRVIEAGERHSQQLHVILLDWEKAFDKVKQDQLFEAIERMGVSEKLITMIKQLYKNPVFNVEMEGHTSNWYKQETGIRQGCPLSPYLFLIVMTAMFHDIHISSEFQQNLENDRVLGALFDEILYADDTIIYSKKQ